MMKLTAYPNYALRSLRLAALRSPEVARVDDVVECFNTEKNTCPLIGICKLPRALREAMTAFMAVHDDLTLAEIASNRGELLSCITPIEEGIVWPTRRTL